MKCWISKAVVLGFSGNRNLHSKSDEGLSRLLEASGVGCITAVFYTFQIEFFPTGDWVELTSGDLF
jgi:hypothetical protein